MTPPPQTGPPPLSFDAYLRRRYTPATAKHYRLAADRYREHLRTRRRDPATATHADVVAFLGALRRRGTHASAVAVDLAAVKALHRFLCDAGYRDDHPCERLTLRQRGGREPPV